MKVGVFDSGLGGLTVLNAMVKAAPAYDYLYLGDSKRAPYGPREFDTILAWTLQAVEYLFQQNCHIIILACNTASAKALRTIQQRYLPEHFPDRRILGVIRPSIEYLADISHSNKVAIWATEGTVKSNSYILEFNHHAPQLEIFQCACPLLVPHIEKGKTDVRVMKEIIGEYWNSTLSLSDKLDTLLLACTHYPLLYDLIKEVVPTYINVVHQGTIIGDKWLDYLKRHPEHADRLSRGSSVEFITTAHEKRFNEFLLKYSGIKGQTHSIQFEKTVQI